MGKIDSWGRYKTEMEKMVKRVGIENGRSRGDG